MRRLLVIAFGALLIVGLLKPAPVLRSAGSTLVHADPVQPVDVIVIAVDAFEPGVIEASDLVAKGVASRVAVFTLAESGVDEELRRRGLAAPTETDRAIATLQMLGVASVERIPTPVNGSTQSIPVLVRWAEEHRVQSLVLVTSTDHSRRVSHVVARNRPRGMRIIVHPSTYSGFVPERWWRTRAGLRAFGEEMPKLAIDAALHPLSYVF